jgi:hypothetical protein
LQKLRVKYAGNENAYDAILYHILTTSEPGLNIPEKLKCAIEFYTTHEGENVYTQIMSGKFDEKVREKVDGKREEEDNIYDYSNDLAKAAQREGNFRKDVISPEILAAEALQRFKKSI